MHKTAVILCNLGGPSDLAAVEPFLKNLFSDPAIIRLPKLFRLPLADYIARKRAPKARHIYEQMGGKSPIVENTEAQAAALEKKLRERGEYKVFITMRYWHPLSVVAARQVKDYNPDRIIFLPLYPQYSTTTTASSFKDWQQAAAKETITATTQLICCYPTEEHFIAAQVNLLEPYREKIENNTARILFSAHGLPEKIVKRGDPYQWQIEQTAKAIREKMGIENADYVVCYQSRVGPMKWLQPSTEAEIKRAGKDSKAIILLPLSFVSEHSETLVELDIEYKQLAAEAGVKHYIRIPTVSTHEEYINGLAQLCLNTYDTPRASHTGGRICPVECGACGSC